MSIHDTPERIVRIKKCDDDNVPAAVPQVQTDWNQTDATKVDFIKNKPEVFDETANDPTSSPTITFQWVGSAWYLLKRKFTANVNIASLFWQDATNAIGLKNGKLFVAFQQGGINQQDYEYIIDCQSFMIQVRASSLELKAVFDPNTMTIYFTTTNSIKIKVFSILITPTIKNAYDASSALKIKFQKNLIEHLYPVGSTTLSNSFLKFPVPRVLNQSTDGTESMPYVWDTKWIYTEAWYDVASSTGTTKLIGLDNFSGGYSIYLNML